MVKLPVGIGIILILILAFTLSACRSTSTDVSLVPTGHAPSPANGGFKNISPADIEALMKKGMRLIDVREPEEYQGGHISGAELVPLNTVPNVAGSWDKQKPLMVICLTGGRSAMAANYLVKQGFSQVYNVNGGMMAYRGPKVQGR